MNKRIYNLSHKHTAESLSCASCTSNNCLILDNCKNSIKVFSSARKSFAYEKGSQLSRSLTDGLYILSRGKLKIYKRGKQDEEIILSFIKPGEIFNVLINDEYDENPFEICALEDSAICFVDSNTFSNMAIADPQLMMSLYRFQHEQLKKFQSKYFRTISMNVPAKVADALITMHEAYGTDSDGNLDLKLSRFEIAGIAATTKEQVSKALSEFKAAGIIKSKAKKIMITDFAKLQKAAGA